MPLALLRDAPDHLREACACLESAGDRRIMINSERAGRLGISNEKFWSCGIFLMRLSGAEENQTKRALDALLAPGWLREFASTVEEAEHPARNFASRAGFVMFTAGGRKLGTIGGAA